MKVINIMVCVCFIYIHAYSGCRMTSWFTIKIGKIVLVHVQDLDLHKSERWSLAEKQLRD